MSPVVRQELPTGAAHCQASATPHSHMEKRMGRPVRFRASRIAV